MVPISYKHITSRPGVSNLHGSEGQIKVYKVTRGPHYDADATHIAEPY